MALKAVYTLSRYATTLERPPRYDEERVRSIESAEQRTVHLVNHGQRKVCLESRLGLRLTSDYPIEMV
jgi:hypothetical protein